MNHLELQRLQVGRCEFGGGVSSFGSMLVSTIIMGFALIIITIIASFALLDKNLIK